MNDNSIIIITRGGVGDVIVCTPNGREEQPGMECIQRTWSGGCGGQPGSARVAGGFLYDPRSGQAAI